MNDFDALLKVVMDELRAIHIPISAQVLPTVTVNRRAKKRFGLCTRRSDNHYQIELSERLLNVDEMACKQTLAHELIHTCYGCGNHGKRFHAYAQKINAAYGYHIKTTNTCEEIGLENPSTAEAKYILQCTRCGKEIPRLRYSNVIQNPSKYRCRCGGTLRRIK